MSVDVSLNTINFVMVGIFLAAIICSSFDDWGNY